MTGSDEPASTVMRIVRNPDIPAQRRTGLNQAARGIVGVRGLQTRQEASGRLEELAAMIDAVDACAEAILERLDIPVEPRTAPAAGTMKTTGSGPQHHQEPRMLKRLAKSKTERKAARKDLAHRVKRIFRKPRGG
jgi:hypothetical protein